MAARWNIEASSPASQIGCEFGVKTQGGCDTVLAHMAGHVILTGLYWEEIAIIELFDQPTLLQIDEPAADRFARHAQLQVNGFCIDRMVLDLEDASALRRQFPPIDSINQTLVGAEKGQTGEDKGVGDIQIELLSENSREIDQLTNHEDRYISSKDSVYIDCDFDHEFDSLGDIIETNNGKR